MRVRGPRKSFVAVVAFLVTIAGCTAGTGTGPSSSAGIVPATNLTPSVGSSAPSLAPPAAPARFAGVDTSDPSKVVVDTGEMRATVTITPQFSVVVVDDRGRLIGSENAGTPVPPSGPIPGLYVVRNGVRSGVRAVPDPSSLRRTDGTAGGDGESVSFPIMFEDGSTGALTFEAVRGGTMGVELRPDDVAGVTNWGMDLTLASGEAIYGLTERITDDLGASELVPTEVGSLDRRGDYVTMYVTPTISGYAPFYQSSKGYGLLVDGTMPGTYDIGRANPDVLTMDFEMSPTTKAGGFHLFRGPTHPEILDEYTVLTGRAPKPPSAVFTNWRGRDEYRKGPTAIWHGIEINADVARDLHAYDEHRLPPGVFHFDRPWATGPEGYGELRFDQERFPNTERMLAEMRKVGWRLMVWTSPWAIGVLGEEAATKGYLAPNSRRAIDLTNPAAAEWIKGKITAFLTSSEGRHIDGFFMDRGEEGDVSSKSTDVYADGRTGREIHNAYVVIYQQIWRAALDEARPDGSGWLISRGAYTGTQAYAMRWGGDTHSREGILLPEVPQTTPTTDKGLRSVLISIQRAAFMGTAYWGSDIGGYSNWVDRDLYARWIQVGAVSPLMRFHGKGPAPWDVNPDGSMDTELLAVYQRYVGLHHDLQPYLDGLADDAARTGLTPVRPLVFTWPDEPGARNRWDEWMLGPDLLTAPVWRSGERSRSVWFPPGRWVNWWDRTTVVEGPVEIMVDVPLDVLPIYAKEGSSLLQG